MTKPVICAITDFAVAGGLELAIWCDLIVCDKNAKLGFVNRRVGVPLIDGGTIRLHRIVGLNRARYMILTGKTISGEIAEQWGLVNISTEKGQVMKKAMQIAADIIRNP